MPRDLTSTLQPLVALVPLAAVTAAQTGITIDRTGFQGVDFEVAMGAIPDVLSASKYYEFYLQHSDDNSTWVDVPAAFVQPGYNPVALAAHVSVIAVIQVQNASPSAINGGYLGDKRYVRLLIAVTGTMTTGTPMAVVAVLGYGRRNPPVLGLKP